LRLSTEDLIAQMKIPVVEFARGVSSSCEVFARPLEIIHLVNSVRGELKSVAKSSAGSNGRQRYEPGLDHYRELFGIHSSIFPHGQGETSNFPPIFFVLVYPAPNSLWLLEWH